MGQVSDFNQREVKANDDLAGVMAEGAPDVAEMEAHAEGLDNLCCCDIIFPHTGAAMKLDKAKHLPYLVAGLTFGAVFVVIGYLGYASASGAEGGYDFWYWVSNRPIRRGVHLWFVFGAAVGVGLRYAFERRPA